MGGRKSKPTVIKEYVTDPKLQELIIQLQNQNRQLKDDFNKLMERIESQEIDSFEDLAKYDAKAAAILTKLASATKPIPMQGRNFGFFGLTSTGKSTIINQLIGKNVAEVGAGETTTNITKYEGQSYCLYDVPGRNDEISYFSMEYISFWKALTARIIVVTSTLKEMTKVIRLLDAIEVTYDIIVNKFDNVDFEEREQFKAKIKGEISSLGLKGAKRIWFVSAEHPKQFPDWLSMVHNLTGDAPQSS